MKTVHIEKCLFLFVSLLLNFALHAQPIKKFSGQSYTVNEGLLVNRVVDIEEDNNGFMWISTGAGLQRFDGSDFQTIGPQPGLPETNHPHFFKLKNGTLWLSYSQGISAYNSVTNKFQVIYKHPGKVQKELSLIAQYETSPLMPVIEWMDIIWCWSVFHREFIGINSVTYKIENRFKLPSAISGVITNFRIGNNGKLFFETGKDIKSIDFNSRQIISIQFPKNEKYYTYCTYKNEVLMLTGSGVYMSGTNNKTELLSNYPSEILSLNISQITIDHLLNNLFGVSVNNQLYVFNAEKREFLYRIVNQRNEPFVTPGYISFSRMGNFNHLWVVTIAEGIKKINFNKLDIKYYGIEDVQKNFTRCIYPDKKANLIITGTLFNGIFAYDTSGHLIKKFNLPPNTAAVLVSCILKIAPYKYLIFVSSHYTVYLLDAIKWKLTPVSQMPDIDYYSTIQPVSDSSAILFHTDGLSKLNYTKQKISFEPLFVKRFLLCGLVDKKKQLWVGATGKYSLLNGENFKDETIFYLKENVVTKCLFQDKNGYIWLGTEKGLYKLDPDNGSVIHVYKKADGLADETIYSVIADDNDNIWCGTNKGISCIYTNGKIINIYDSDGLQANEFNTNSNAKAEDGELFFGGINGVNSFYPDKMEGIIEKPYIIMTTIKVMDTDWNTDTAAWNLQLIKLPYTQNILSFNFTALGWYSPEVYHYQYRMVGIEKEWVNAGNLGYARYALPPGKYTFEYTATNNLNKNSDAYLNKKYISIIIKAPFWQSWWFIGLMIACMIILLFVAVQFYNKRKYQKKLRQLEIQKTVQEERERISRDLHDNIGAYTTVLIANAEQLNKHAASSDIKASAQTVSENAKNIMGSLQETIWILNSDTITITDFADRFKLYAKKIVKNFSEIHLNFKEQIQNDANLFPAEALNLFRILQEALQNSVKHSKPRNIILSIFSNDSIYISLKDDGKGFDTQNISMGHGLNNMQHRAKEAGYEFKIISNEEGTEIAVQKNKSYAV